MCDILKEEAARAVNEVQLKDVFAEASRTEMQIIKLSELAINFSDNKIKQAVMGLRSKAHQLTVLISDVMLATDQTMGDLEDVPEEAGTEDTRVDLEAGSDKKVIESVNIVSEAVINNRAVLAEAFNESKRQINLVTAYKMITEGTCTFAQFKGTIFKALNEANFGEEYKTLVNEIRDAGTPEVYEVAMNKIYDFADANDITIKTA